MLTKIKGFVKLAATVEYVRFNGAYVKKPSDMSYKYSKRGSWFAVLDEGDGIKLVNVFDDTVVIKTKNVKNMYNVRRMDAETIEPKLLGGHYHTDHHDGDDRYGTGLLHHLLVANQVELVANYKYNKEVFIRWLRLEMGENNTNWVMEVDNDPDQHDFNGPINVLYRDLVDTRSESYIDGREVILSNIDEVLSIQNKVFRMYLDIIEELGPVKPRVMSRLMTSFKLVAIVMSNMYNKSEGDDNIDLGYILKAYTYYNSKLTRPVDRPDGEADKLIKLFIR